MDEAVGDAGVPGELEARAGDEVGRLALLDAAVRALTGVAEHPVTVSNPGVDALVTALGELSRRVEAARVALVGEAVERGLVTESGAASPVDWVLHRAPGMAPAEAKAVVDVARAGGAPDVAPVATAVRAGRVPVRVAGVVLTEYRRLAPQLVPEAAPAVLAGMLDMGAGHGVAGVRALRERIVADHAAAGTLDREQATLARGRALSAGWEARTGMRHFELVLDPEGAATLEAALSPLAAPQPSAWVPGVGGGPDLRGAERRRADALLELVGRAVASAEHVPTTAKASLVVTLDYATLAEGVGAGTTPDGRHLSPGVVRRMACDAAVLPMVLGSQGEVLDVGREQRLVTPRLLKALWVRDRGCTFPGCTRPPGWCHAHHVRHWARGGRTDLGNLALLCARHHTHVHLRDLTATVTGAGVSWGTVPESGGSRRATGPP